jgi:hypothetical protein
MRWLKNRASRSRWALSTLAGPSRAGKGTVTMQPTIASGVVQGVPQRSPRRSALRQARSWFQARIAATPSTSCMKSSPAGAASQGEGSRVPVHSNSCSQSSLVMPQEMTPG